MTPSEENLNTEDLTAFFSTFNKLENSLRTFRNERDINSWVKLFSAYQPIEVKHNELLKQEAPDYNLFEILNIERFETKVHSPFLKHLLNPYESHKQERLFFDLFMKNILGERYIPEKVSSIDVMKKEFRFSNGQIDVLIRYKSGSEKKVLLIENKIYHHDEDKQLERYYHFLIDECKLKKGNYHLVYLKPYKSPPSSVSINPELYAELKNDGSLIELGYYENIAPWLESVLYNIQAPVVLQTIRQYIKTITTL